MSPENQDLLANCVWAAAAAFALFGVVELIRAAA